MSNPTFKFLRGRTLYDNLAVAKEALETKVAQLQQGEPAVVYYKQTIDGTERHLALFGIGGPTSATTGTATGTGVFYNTIEVESAIAALGAQISGSTEDDINQKITLYALKKYTDSKSAAATTRVQAGNGISVTESEDTTTKAKTYSVAANVKLEYVKAVTEQGKEAGAKIKIVDATNTGTTFGTIEVSDIIGNGILKSTSYDEKTGKLTLTFNTASGTTKTEEVDLRSLIDVNDVSISEDSKVYLSVKLDSSAAETGGSQAVFSALVKDVSKNEDGLANAKNVKSYVDTSVANKNVDAAGDTYVSATATNNKVTITINVAGFTVTTGGTSDSTITGTDGKLASSKDIANAITNFTNARITEQINKLNKDNTSVTGTNVSFNYSQSKGIPTISDLNVAYTTVTNKAHSGDASAQTAFITVSDSEKIAKGKDVSAASTYAKALSTEDRAYTDAKIATLDSTKEAKNTVDTNGNDLAVKVSEIDGLITGVTATITTLNGGTF